MAYMSQEKKAKIAPKVKEVLKRYGVKGSLAVHNHSTLILNIKSGKLDFISNFNKTCSEQEYRVHTFMPATDYIDVNPYHFDKHFVGLCLAFLSEVYEAMMEGNHDNSDIQTDYFDVGWYVNINIGRWDKPYVLERKEEV